MSSLCWMLAQLIHRIPQGIKPGNGEFPIFDEDFPLKLSKPPFSSVIFHCHVYVPEGPSQETLKTQDCLPNCVHRSSRPTVQVVKGHANEKTSAILPVLDDGAISS